MGDRHYLATAHKPTAVTHSCVCNFTGSDKTNLILAKCTSIEIHQYEDQYEGDGLVILLDVPIYGRIATLEPFRLHSDTQDCLFVATEECKYFVLQWDPLTSKPVTRGMGDITKPNLGCHNNPQIGIVDPTRRLIILYSSDGLFKVMHFDDNGFLNQNFDTRLWVYKVLDIKFLLDCSDPTIAVLYQDINGVHHIKTYKVSLENRCFVEGSFSKTNLPYGDHLLISVPPPLGGVLVIGCENIAYYNANVFKTIPMELEHGRVSFTKAYARVDSFRYLIGDHAGILRLLELTRDQENVIGLKLEHLGETSIPSSISYLNNEVVYIGSSYGDSQLIKVNLLHDQNREEVKVFKRYGNLGPIQDFCMVDLERQGLGGLVVTCSGAYKDGSLRIVYNALGVNELGSEKCEGAKGMWSLKSSTDDPFDKFLAVTFMNGTRFLEMTDDGVLNGIEIGGFCSDEWSLFCHDAIHEQLLQVTCSSVRLVSSLTKALRDNWSAPSGSSLAVATANATQILLATASGELVYLEIGDGVLCEKKRVELNRLISCLDINSISDNPNRSHLAAVGSWDCSFAIYSLPGLVELTKVAQGVIPQSEALQVPRSVLLCAFEGIPYLLCGLGSGDLLYFLLDKCTGDLRDKKIISPGATPITTLRTSSSNVLAVSSDWSILISSSGKKLLFSNINLRELTDMCPFKTGAFPEGYAMTIKGDLTIGTIDGKLKLHIHRSIPLGEHARCICHQQQTKTYAICTVESKLCGEELQSHLEDSEQDYVRCLDDENFEFRTSFSLHTGEHGRCIISCSFSEDNKEYYCVGTAYVFQHQNESYKGRILIFSVEDEGFKLIAQTETRGAVYCLNGFDTKLLAAVGRSIQLYKLVRKCDGTCELQMECAHSCDILALCMQTRNKSIVVGDLKSILLLMYKGGEGAIGEEKHDLRNSLWMSAIEFLTDRVYLGATRDLNLCIARSSDIHELDCFVHILGEYHLGQFINRFRHGSVVRTVPWSEVDLIQSVGTVPCSEVDPSQSGTVPCSEVDPSQSGTVPCSEVDPSQSGTVPCSEVPCSEVDPSQSGTVPCSEVDPSQSGTVPCSEVDLIQSVTFGTDNGMIGVVSSLSKEEYVLLRNLQHAIGDGVGGLNHTEWRGFSLGKNPSCFVDGDISELFLGLERSEMERISVEMGVSVGELCNKVEKLRR